MSSRPPVVDVEEIQTTRSEKALAVVLVVFLLIGAGWAYEQLGDAARGTFEARIDAEDRAAVARLDAAEIRSAEAAAAERRAFTELVTAREAYRTALDADEPALTLRRAYERRQRDVIAAEAARNAAEADADAVRPAALAAADRIATEEQTRARSRRTARLRPPARGARRVARGRALAARSPATRGLALAARGVRARRRGDRARAVPRGRLRLRLPRPAGLRAARDLARRHRADARRLRGAPALPRETHPCPARPEGRVPVLRLSGRTGRPLRGLWQERRRRLRDLRRPSPGGNAPLPRVRRLVSPGVSGPSSRRP